MKKHEVIIREYATRSGQMFENFGFPRISGEVGALLYLHKGKMSLDEISNFLGVSKGSVSTNTRFLMRMKYIKSVRVPGDRKDYYEFSGDLWQSLDEALESFIRTQVDDFRQMNDQYLNELLNENGLVKDEIEQRKYMVGQLSALNTLYKYIDVLRRVSEILKKTPINKFISNVKELANKSKLKIKK